MKRIFRLIPIHVLHARPGESINHFVARVKLRIHFSFLREVKRNSSETTVGKMMYLSFSFLVQGRIYIYIHITYVQGNKRPHFKVGFHPRLYREIERNAPPSWNSVFLSSVARIR